MSRTVDEWIGRSDNTPAPPRVRLRRFFLYDGRCASCTRKLGAGVPWQLDHVKPLIAGGANRETNLQPLCSTCHKSKTADDIQDKSIVYRKQLKHAGIKKATSRPIPGSRTSGIRKRMSGKIESW